MRTLTLALVAGLTVQSISAVRAADLDYGVLRGADYETEVAVIDWSGVYVGAHAGYTSAALDFNNVFQPIVAKALRQTAFESALNASGLLANRSVRVDGSSFGAYAGWNYQFDDTVLGIEVDYTRFDKLGQSTDGIARFTVDSTGWYRAVALDGISSTRIEDYGTIRARAGYALGSLLPFVTGGFAIGRAEVNDQVNIQAHEYDQTTYRANAALVPPATPVAVGNSGYKSFNPAYPDPSSPPADPAQTRTVVADPVPYRVNKTKVVGGIALGAGVEWALTQNIVLRGEYQYVLFNDFDGHKVNINTVRAGAALKF